MPEDEDLQVIEAPANGALTINERRAAMGVPPLVGVTDV